METVFNLTPSQSFFFLALNAWIFIIFPVIVIRKLNRLTEIVESYFYAEDEDDQDQDNNQSGPT